MEFKFLILYWWKLIFLAIRCNKELAGQISSKPKVPINSSEFSSISTHRSFFAFLVQIPFRNWRSFYEERCSLSQALSTHILFGMFGALEFHRLVKTIRARLKSVWIIGNHHCSFGLGPLHFSFLAGPRTPASLSPTPSRCQPLLRRPSGPPPVGARPHAPHGILATRPPPRLLPSRRPL
jgi:hypothetical protein